MEVKTYQKELRQGRNWMLTAGDGAQAAEKTMRQLALAQRLHSSCHKV